MKTGFTPWSELLEHTLEYQHAACFALGCVEREHRLTLDAWMACWARAPLVWWPAAAGAQPHPER